SEGNRAVEAPDAEHALLDMRQVEREAKRRDGEGEHNFVGALQSEYGEQKVSADADDGDGNAVGLGEYGIRTVVDDAAIPVLIDVADRFAVRAVLLAQSERRDYDSDQGENHKNVFHSNSFSLSHREKSAKTGHLQKSMILGQDYIRPGDIITTSMKRRRNVR